MIDGVPAGADLFAEGEKIEIAVRCQTFGFMGILGSGLARPRVAVAIEACENKRPDICRVLSLVFTEDMTVKLILALQQNLQEIQALAPGVDDERSRDRGGPDQGS